MAASLFSQSCTVASSIYTTAISSLNMTALPTLLPSSPSAPIDLMFSAYTTQLLSMDSPLPLLAFAQSAMARLPQLWITVQMRLPVETLLMQLARLTVWQITHAVIFLGVVGVLSWMLDSHHSDDDESDIKAPSVAADGSATAGKQDVAVAVASASAPATLSLASRSRRRRQTLETIATLINLEDVHHRSSRRKSCAQLPSSFFLPHYSHSLPQPRSRSLSSPPVASSPPTSPTEATGQLIPVSSGQSATLLKRAEEQEKSRRRRKSSPRGLSPTENERVKQQLEEVAGYDAVVRLSTEQAEMRRIGGWRTKLLLGLRMPVRWTMG